MRKSKSYEDVKFSARILRQTVEQCCSLLKCEPDDDGHNTYRVSSGDEEWRFDNFDEFVPAYADADVTSSTLGIWWNGTQFYFHVELYPWQTQVSVRSSSRAEIESVFSVFEQAPTEDRIKLKKPKTIKKPIIFIGHGRANDWMILKSHLQDKHQLHIEAYETGARAGHVIRDILEDMANTASFALLVLTGEDETLDNKFRARQNVIHETGLFQGRLGFDRAIMLVEREIDLGSNFDGIQQIRFDKGRITETFGDVLATLRREFGPI